MHFLISKGSLGKKQDHLDHFAICACHSCAGAMLIFYVSFQFYQMSPKRIHNVFHVGLLRKYVSDPNHVLPELLKAAPEGELLAEPERILKVDTQHLRNRSFSRFLVKWKDYLDDEASWEREVDFGRDYPNFVIEDNDLF